MSPAPLTEFTADFTVEAQDKTFAGSLAVSDRDRIVFTFSEPEDMRALTLTAGEEKLLLDFGDRTEEMDPALLADDALVLLLSRSIRACLFDGLSVERTDEGYFIHTGAAGCPATARFAADGTLTELICPEKNIRMALTYHASAG